MALSVDQLYFRVRDDSTALNTDGGWLAAEDTDPSAIGTGTVNRFRIRFTLQASNATGTTTPYLRCSRNSGAYFNVTASSSYVQVTGGLPTDGATCSSQLLSNGVTGTFEGEGTYDEGDGTLAAWSNDKQNYSEWEVCVYIVDADVSNGDTLDFRLEDASGNIDTWTSIPQITVSKGSTASSEGVARVHPRGLGEAGTDIETDATPSRVHPRGVGEAQAVTKVACQGKARSTVRALAAGLWLVTYASPSAVHPRAVGESETNVAAQGVSRVHPRAIGFASTGDTAESQGKSRIHPRGLGAATTVVYGEGVTRVHPRGIGASETTVDSQGKSRVHPRGIGESQSDASSQGKSRVHPRALAAATTDLGCVGKSRVHPRAIGETKTKVDAEGLSRVHPRGIGFSQLTGTTAASEGKSRAHPRGLGESQTEAASVGKSRVHPRGIGQTETAVAAAGKSRVHPRAVGASGTIVPSSGLSRVHPRCVAEAITKDVLASEGVSRVHPRAISEATTDVAAEGVSRTHPRAVGEAETTVQGSGKSRTHPRAVGSSSLASGSQGVARVHPRTVTPGPIILRFTTRPSKVHPRAVGEATTGIIFQGKSRVHPRAIGVSQTDVNVVAGPSRAHPRGLGTGQLSSGNLLSYGEAKVHPRAVGVARTDVASSGVSRVHPRAVGPEPTTAVSSGVSRVHPRGIGQSVVSSAASGVSRAHSRAVGQAVSEYRTYYTCTGDPDTVSCGLVSPSRIKPGPIKALDTFTEASDTPLEDHTSDTGAEWDDAPLGTYYTVRSPEGYCEKETQESFTRRSFQDVGGEVFLVGDEIYCDIYRPVGWEAPGGALAEVIFASQYTGADADNWCSFHCLMDGTDTATFWISRKWISGFWQQRELESFPWPSGTALRVGVVLTDVHIWTPFYESVDCGYRTYLTPGVFDDDDDYSFFFNNVLYTRMGIGTDGTDRHSDSTNVWFDNLTHTGPSTLLSGDGDPCPIVCSGLPDPDVVGSTPIDEPGGIVILPQTIRPDGDVSYPIVIGSLNWHNASCGLTTAYGQINDDSDLSYLRNGCDNYGVEGPNSVASADVTLQNPARTPTNSDGVLLCARASALDLDVSAFTTLVIQLRQGLTIIASISCDNNGDVYGGELIGDGSWVDLEYELSEAEFTTITDFNALHIVLVVNSSVMGAPPYETACLVKLSNVYVYFPV